MGWPARNFFVDVIFSTTHALRVFRKVSPRALGRALHYKVCAQHVLSHCSVLCGKMHVFLKKGGISKKFGVSADSAEEIRSCTLLFIYSCYYGELEVCSEMVTGCKVMCGYSLVVVLT